MGEGDENIYRNNIYYNIYYVYVTALHYAAEYGHGGIVEALLKAGCNAGIQDKV